MTQYIRVQWVLHPERDQDLIEHRERLLQESPGAYSQWLREAAREKLIRGQDQEQGSTTPPDDIADVIRSVLRQELPGLLAQWLPGQPQTSDQPGEDQETTEILDSLFTSFDEETDQ